MTLDDFLTEVSRLATEGQPRELLAFYRQFGPALEPQMDGQTLFDLSSALGSAAFEISLEEHARTPAASR